MGSILQIIANALGFGQWFAKLQSQKQERYNAPDMVQNKRAEQDLKEKEKIQRDAESDNLDELRKDVAED